MANSIITKQKDDLADVHPQVMALLLLASLNGYNAVKKLLLSSVISPQKNGSVVPSHQHRLQRVAEALSAKAGPNNSLRRQIVADVLQIIRQAPKWELEDAFEILKFLKNDRQVAKGLLALIQDDHLNNLGISAAQAIGEIGQIDKDVATSLLQIVEDSQQRKWLRVIVAEALEKLGQVETRGQLLTKIAPDMRTEDNIYYHIAYILKELGVLDKAGELLLNLAKKEHADCIYRSYAVGFLGKLGWTSDAIINELLNLGLDEQVDEQFRVSAAESLTELGQVEAAEQIWLKLAPANQLSSWARTEALKGLQTLGRHEELIQVWRQMAQDKEYPFRYEAAEKLGKTGLVDEAKQLLLDIIQDNQQISYYGGGFENGRKILASIQALGKMGWLEEARDLLRGYAQNKRMHQFEVARTMGELGQEEEACQLLLQQIENHKSDGAHISCKFAMTLGKFGQVEQARQLLLTKAQDPKDFADHRIDAAGCLGELGYMDEASQLLVNLASDRQIDNKFRYQAGRTLWLKLGQVEQAKQVFLNLLKTRQFDNETRDDIIDSLRESGQIKDESVVQIVITELLQLLSNNQLHEHTRCKVAYDLGRLGRGNKLIFKKLFRMAGDDQVHNRIRCGAYQGLREFLELKSSDIFTCPHQ